MKFYILLFPFFFFYQTAKPSDQNNSIFSWISNHPFITLLGAGTTLTFGYNIIKGIEGYHKIKKEADNIIFEKIESEKIENNSCRSIDSDYNRLNEKYTQLKEDYNTLEEKMKKDNETIEEQNNLIHVLKEELIKKKRIDMKPWNDLLEENAKLHKNNNFLTKQNLKLLHLADDNQYLIEENKALRNTLNSTVADCNKLNNKNESLLIENFTLRMSKQ